MCGNGDGDRLANVQLTVTIIKGEGNLLGCGCRGTRRRKQRRK